MCQILTSTHIFTFLKISSLVCLVGTHRGSLTTVKWGRGQILSREEDEEEKRGRKQERMELEPSNV